MFSNSVGIIKFEIYRSTLYNVHSLWSANIEIFEGMKNAECKNMDTAIRFSRTPKQKTIKWE